MFEEDALYEYYKDLKEKGCFVKLINLIDLQEELPYDNFIVPNKDDDIVYISSDSFIDYEFDIEAINNEPDLDLKETNSLTIFEDMLDSKSFQEELECLKLKINKALDDGNKELFKVYSKRYNLLKLEL